MRAHLLGGAGDGHDTERQLLPRRRRLPPLRGGSGDDYSCVGFCVAAIFVLVSGCISALNPNEYGLQRNFITGAIAYDVRRGGIYLTGPFKGFVTFPAALVSLQFSRSAMSDRLPVVTRTGADPQDPDSGGQPIQISCALQIEFVQEALPKVYLSFGSYEAARQRYILLASNVVGNTAQDFVPTDFWTRRDAIAAHMLREINRTLWRQGSVKALYFQILRVDFADKYEDSITQIQVAEQAKVVNEYEQQVQAVVQSIEVLRSNVNANIANVSAGAAADAKRMCANANRDAFALKQSVKAQKYMELRERLGFNTAEMQEFFRIHILQKSGGRVVIGMPGPAGVSLTPSSDHSPSKRDSGAKSHEPRAADSAGAPARGDS